MFHKPKGKTPPTPAELRQRVRRRLTLRGVQYELTDAPLGSAFPLGVSNHIITPQAEIDVRRGLLLVGWELPPLKNL